ncbi:NAD(+) diphosphatase [Citreimonas salinaria]|uniref:NAD(+) diphosphatase n=1 Tax=Citreimonas salinaria TaxID=321339 RepID=A0A1H3M8U0_9RHOB|nr:NAD(+) diphosphatase [Citreimonas salinaria]SDY73147.1 NAD+ diphosphatase [Citreimonas salinaria]
MRHAETVTFGGSALDRAAELRGDPAALAEAARDPKAHSVLLWRGKPLVTGEDALNLPRLPADHPVLKDAPGAPLFLGREAGAPVFARDMTEWHPEDFDETQLGGFFDPREQRHPALDASQRFAELRRVMTRLNPRDAELAATARALFGWHATHGFCARCGAASELAQGGWQRVCPACGARHFPRTDPVVIMLITRGNSTLLGRSHGWPGGLYSCLAGFVEPGETIEAAVRREVFEESGIAVGRVRYLASQPWPFPASLMIGCHGEALDDAISLDPVELEDARWVSREELADVFAGTRSDIVPAREGAIAHFLLRNWLADRLD